MTPFWLACLSYLGLALPGATLGLLCPSMRQSLHAPLSALAFFLASGTVASVLSSAATGRTLSRLGAGWLVARGTEAVAPALLLEAAAPALWVLVAGAALFSLGFGAVDTALNAHAAVRFNARQVNWMHASYGLGATIGPLAVTALLVRGVSWRWTYAAFGALALALAAPLARLRHGWARGAAVPATEAPSLLPPARPPGRRHGTGSRSPWRGDAWRAASAWPAPGGTSARRRATPSRATAVLGRTDAPPFDRH